MQASGFVLVDVFDSIQNAALKLEIKGTNTLTAPALQGPQADVPTFRQLALIEVFYAHFSLLSGNCEFVSWTVLLGLWGWPPPKYGGEYGG